MTPNLQSESPNSKPPSKSIPGLLQIAAVRSKIQNRRSATLPLYVFQDQRVLALVISDLAWSGDGFFVVCTWFPYRGLAGLFRLVTVTNRLNLPSHIRDGQESEDGTFLRHTGSHSPVAPHGRVIVSLFVHPVKNH